MKYSRRMRGIIIDGMIGVCLLAAAGGSGYYYLRTQVGTIGDRTGDYSTGLFLPSVVFASGKGLVGIPVTEQPQLREFLEFKKAEFDPRSLPDNLPVRVSVRGGGALYLQYAVGVVWRLCGISWEMLKVVPAVALAFSVALAYGLFRLGANRFLSVVSIPRQSRGLYVVSRSKRLCGDANAAPLLRATSTVAPSKS